MTNLYEINSSVCIVTNSSKAVLYIPRYIIQLIEQKGTDEAARGPMWKGVLYSVILLLVLCGNSFLYHITFHHMMTLGLKVKTALICLIYKKVS